MSQRYRDRIPLAVALRPRAVVAMPAVRARIEALQSELLDELHRIDALAQDLVWRRQRVVGELRRCRDGLGLVGVHRKREPLPGDIDTEPAGTIEIGGPELRRAVTTMVQVAGAPVDVSQIHRLLLAHGRRPEGRPSQAISNALRPEVAAGRIVRLGRGVYGAPP